MTGEHLIAPDVADEIVVQATLRLTEPPTDDDDALTLTVGGFKQAIVAVLARYGARLTDEDDAVDEHELARLHDEGNPNHD